jgi:hypothetical protein
MSQAYAEKATGDYLWQVDIDEFYQPDDMRRVIAMLEEDPTISAVSFKQIQFWGGFSYWVDSWFLRMGDERFHRLFRWGEGYKYKTHRPPTVLNAEGIDTRRLNWITPEETARRGIFLYHYSFVFPKQAREKSAYYAAAGWSRRDKGPRWAEDVYMNLRSPFRVHNVYQYPGWLERYAGSHPPEIEALRAELEAGHGNIDIRPVDDIERLLEARWYKRGKAVLKRTVPLAWVIRLWLLMKRTVHGLLTDPTHTLRLISEKAFRLHPRK